MGQNQENNQTKRTIPHDYDTALTGSGMLVKYCRHCPSTFVLLRQEDVDSKTQEVVREYYAWIPVETVDKDGKPTQETRNCVGNYSSETGERGRDTREETTPVRRVNRLP